MSQLLLLEKHQSQNDNSLDEFEKELLLDEDIDQYFEENYDDNAILAKTIEERNEAFKTIYTDISLLKDIFMDCATLIFGQGEQLNEAENNIEKAVQHTDEAVVSLEKTVEYTATGRGKLFDLCVMLGGVGLGSLGWIGGPWIGIPTMAAGLGVSTSVVVARNKLSN